MRKLRESTFESYWSNGGAEALKNRFHEICSDLGVWTKDDKGCENFGLYLKVGHSYSDENDLRLRIVSPKYYLSDNGADMWARPNSTEDFDEWVTEYIKEYSWLFEEKDSDAYKHLVKSENPEPWNTFVANEGSFRKALRQAFKSNECKYIDMDEQYDIYGEEHFEVDSTSDDAELSITFNWCGDKNPDDYILFKFDNDLNYTTTMNGETVTGQGYEDAAKQYVLRIANKYAKGEFAKEYEPECYELRVYLRQDFYTKASKNIWQSIESILEGNCGTYTNYQPEDWVDDKAAVWTSVEVDDLKRVLDWLKKRRSAPRIEIWDENKKNVTSQFWTPKVEESVKKLKEDVILHFDLEDGTHKALPFKSEEDALEYLDSDDFPVGEWVGSYTIEPVDSATVSTSNGDEECPDEDDFYDEDDYDEPFYIVLDDGYHKIQELVDDFSMPIYKAVNFSNKDDAIVYALEHPEVCYVQEMFGPDLCDCYEGDFVWERGQEDTSLTEAKSLSKNKKPALQEALTKKQKNYVLNYVKEHSFFPCDNGESFYFLVPVDDKHIKMTPKFKKQLKDEGLYGNTFIGGMTDTAELPIDMMWLPIYGDPNKYVTKWLSHSFDSCFDSDLRDRGRGLSKRLDLAKMSEDKNCVVVKILDSFDTKARNVIESYGGQLDYDIWSISKENIQDVKDEIDDWKNRIAFYSSYNYSTGKFGKELTEAVVKWTNDIGEATAYELNQQVKKTLGEYGYSFGGNQSERPVCAPKKYYLQDRNLEGHTTYLLSVKGEYYDEIIIQICDSKVCGMANYTIRSPEGVLWMGQTPKEFVEDIRDMTTGYSEM